MDRMERPSESQVDQMLQQLPLLIPDLTPSENKALHRLAHHSPFVEPGTIRTDFSLSQIAKKAGSGQSTVRRLLDKLAKYGAYSEWTYPRHRYVNAKGERKYYGGKSEKRIRLTVEAIGVFLQHTLEGVFRKPIPMRTEESEDLAQNIMGAGCFLADSLDPLLQLQTSAVSKDGHRLMNDLGKKTFKKLSSLHFATLDNISQQEWNDIIPTDAYIFLSSPGSYLYTIIEGFTHRVQRGVNQQKPKLSKQRGRDFREHANIYTKLSSIETEESLLYMFKKNERAFSKGDNKFLYRRVRRSPHTAGRVAGGLGKTSCNEPIPVIPNGQERDYCRRSLMLSLDKSEALLTELIIGVLQPRREGEFSVADLAVAFSQFVSRRRAYDGEEAIVGALQRQLEALLLQNHREKNRIRVRNYRNRVKRKKVAGLLATKASLEFDLRAAQEAERLLISLEKGEENVLLPDLRRRGIRRYKDIDSRFHTWGSRFPLYKDDYLKWMGVLIPDDEARDALLDGAHFRSREKLNRLRARNMLYVLREIAGKYEATVSISKTGHADRGCMRALLSRVGDDPFYHVTRALEIFFSLQKSLRSRDIRTWKPILESKFRVHVDLVPGLIDLLGKPELSVYDLMANAHLLRILAGGGQSYRQGPLKYSRMLRRLSGLVLTTRPKATPDDWEDERDVLVMDAFCYTCAHVQQAIVRPKDFQAYLSRKLPKYIMDPLSQQVTANAKQWWKKFRGSWEIKAPLNPSRQYHSQLVHNASLTP